MKIPMALRRRLAKEARGIAYECAEGLAHDLGVGVVALFAEPLCAVGATLWRSGVRRSACRYGIEWPSQCVQSAVGAVCDANDGAADSDRHAAVVFPLLALADALEGK